MKPIKGAEKFSDKMIPQHKRLALGLPVNKGMKGGRGPKTPC